MDILDQPTYTHTYTHKATFEQLIYILRPCFQTRTYWISSEYAPLNDAQNIILLIPHLLVDVPDLPDQFAIRSIIELVMQH